MDTFFRAHDDVITRLAGIRPVDRQRSVEAAHAYRMRTLAAGARRRPATRHLGGMREVLRRIRITAPSPAGPCP